MSKIAERVLSKEQQEMKNYNYQYLHEHYSFAQGNSYKLSDKHEKMFMYIVEMLHERDYPKYFEVDPVKLRQASEITNKKTYKNVLLDLVETGLFKIHQQGKNKHCKCILILKPKLFYYNVIHYNNLSHFKNSYKEISQKPKCTSTVPQVYPKCTSTVPQVYPKCTSTVPLESEKEENTEPKKAPQANDSKEKKPQANAGKNTKHNVHADARVNLFQRLWVLE